jgi:hypothetical protein
MPADIRPKENTVPLRIPKAELPEQLTAALTRQIGKVAEPVEVMYNNPEVARSTQEFSGQVAAGAPSARA